jgi:hypothetical protein
MSLRCCLPKINLAGAKHYGGTGNTIARSGDEDDDSRAPREDTVAWLLAAKPFKIPISGVAVLTELGLGLIWCNLLANMGARQRVA